MRRRDLSDCILGFTPWAGGCTIALRLGGRAIGRKKVAARQRARFEPKIAERYARFLDVSSGELLFGMAVKPATHSLHPAKIG